MNFRVASRTEMERGGKDGVRFCPSVSISEVPGFPDGNPHFHPVACSVLQPELLTEGRGLDLHQAQGALRGST